MQRVKNLRETVACASRNRGFSLNSLILLDPRSGAYVRICVLAQYTIQTAAGPVILDAIYAYTSA